ncbi:unnamed protein product [Clavelina lepadiformis]|uniref:Carboxylesterase type B domain-containing protein n=1 Tax=Clavelina lepadiformis TaxID=159417 RepID=A0ABP0H1W7_CLALP
MADCPVVNTFCGKVKGRLCLKAKSPDAKQVFRFSSIPFAKPPVGQLRFEPPQKCEQWEGIRDATKPSSVPVRDQHSCEVVRPYAIIVDEFEEGFSQAGEDCLYLDVYTTNPSKEANLPVLFWLNGEITSAGTKSGCDGQAICGLHDVVLVAPNYRTEIFGFFSTGKNTSYPGNMALLDQVMALEWARDNIENFGGNPSNITLCGVGLGASSAGLHMISPMSKGLFHKAIQHSGTCIAPGLLKQDCSLMVKELGKVLDLPNAEPADIVKKLKCIPARKLIELCSELAKVIGYFTVTVDGKFLSDTPRNLIQKGAISNVPSIIGCNSAETNGIMNWLFPPAFSTGFTQEELKETLDMFVTFLYDGKSENTRKVLKKLEHYKKNFPDDDKLKWSKIAGQICGDAWYVVPCIEQAIRRAEDSEPVYMYYMKQQLRCHHEDEYSIDLQKKVTFCECDHGDDVVFTFGVPLMNGKMMTQCKFSEEEKELTKAWMTYITNFATNGDPNKGKFVHCQWPPYVLGAQRHLTVQMPLCEDDHLIEDRFKLWTENIAFI